MDWYINHKLIEQDDGYVIEIYLNRDMPEFADEFLSDVKRNVLKLDDKIKKLVEEKYGNFKIKTVKILLGTLVVASIPLAAGAMTASAAPVATQSATQLNTTGRVSATKLNVRSSPSTSGSIIHALWQGNNVKVIGQSGNWYQIRLSDGRTGWVSSTYLVLDKATLNTTGTVTATKLNVRSGPSTSNTAIHLLWEGNRVNVIGESNGWYQIRLSDGRTGWVSRQYLNLGGGQAQPPANTQQKTDQVIAVANSFLGTPYVWGGDSPAEGGFDCSGFTQYVFKQAGYSLNRISADQAKQGVAVARSNLKPGDLVFASFNKNSNIDHVGIYIGNGQMIHSPKTGDVVKITNINVSYWQERFVTARRIIT